MDERRAKNRRVVFSRLARRVLLVVVPLPSILREPGWNNALSVMDKDWPHVEARKC